MNNYLKIGFSVLRLIAVPALNFLTLSLGIKFLGKENWGAFISVSIWIYFLVFITKWAGQNYLIKEFSKNPSKMYPLFYSNFIERSGFLVLAVFLFFGFPIPVALASSVLLILIHIYSSFDSLIIYHQKFKLQFIAEIIGFFVLISSLFLMKKFDLILLIYFFCFSYLIKIGVLLFDLKLPFRGIALKIDWRNSYQTFPFFLIGFSGWLDSRVDIYVVSYYFSKEKLAEYQLLITSFLLLQSFSGYLIIPFYKHFFRLSKKTIQKIKTKMELLAFPFVLVATVAIWVVLEKIIDLNFSIYFYLIGGLSTIPSFYYAIDILQLYRKDKEKTIVKISFVCITINLILMVLLIPVFDILGVLLSVFILQWLYLFIIKREIKKLHFV